MSGWSSYGGPVTPGAPTESQRSLADSYAARPQERAVQRLILPFVRFNALFARCREASHAHDGGPAPFQRWLVSQQTAGRNEPKGQVPQRITHATATSVHHFERPAELMPRLVIGCEAGGLMVSEVEHNRQRVA